MCYITKYLHDVDLADFEYEFAEITDVVGYPCPPLKIYVNIEGCVLEHKPYNKAYDGESDWEMHSTGLVSLCIYMGIDESICKSFELDEKQSDIFLQSYPEIEDALICQAMENPEDGKEWIDE